MGDVPCVNRKRISDNLDRDWSCSDLKEVRFACDDKNGLVGNIPSETKNRTAEDLNASLEVGTQEEKYRTDKLCHKATSSNGYMGKVIEEAEKIVVENVDGRVNSVDCCELTTTPKGAMFGASSGGSRNENGSSLRENLKHRETTENSIVFNFINSPQRDVTHIENDGLDLSKRLLNKTCGKNSKQLRLPKQPGVTLLHSAAVEGQLTEDDNVPDIEKSSSILSGDYESYKFTFIGANVVTGKSSIRSKPKEKKLNISFSESLTEVFEYFAEEQHPTSATAESDDSDSSQFNTKNHTVGNFGGLGSYTPSKIQLEDVPFQLGVSRTLPNCPTKSALNSSSSGSLREVLRPTDDAVSWSGSSASSDILF